MTERYIPEPFDEQPREPLALWAKLTPKKRSVALQFMRAFV